MSDTRLRTTEQGWSLPKDVDMADTLEYYGTRSDARDLIDIYMEAGGPDTNVGDYEIFYEFVGDYIMGVVYYIHCETEEKRERPFVIKLIPPPNDDELGPP